MGNVEAVRIRPAADYATPQVRQIACNAGNPQLKRRLDQHLRLRFLAQRKQRIEQQRQELRVRYILLRNNLRDLRKI